MSLVLLCGRLVEGATTDTWTGGGADANWSSLNWSTTNPGGVPLAGDSLIFAGTTRLTNTNNLAVDISIAGITFDNTAGAFVIGGSEITLAGNILDSSSALETLNLNMITTAVRTVTLGSGGVTLGGLISGTGGGFNLSGSGTLTLSGANTYTGNTTLAANTTLNFNNASAIGTGTLVINGGTLNNSTAAAITNSKNNLQTWAGDFAFTGTKDLNLGTGAVTMSASRVVTVNGGTLTVGGAVGGGAVSLTKAGSGTLALSGASTFSGGMNINAGAVRLATSGGAGGSGSIAVGASGILVGASATTFTSPIALNGGVLGGNGGPTFSSAITVNADSTIRIADPANLTTNSEIFVTGTLGGSGNLNVLSGNQTNVDGGSGFRLRGTGTSTYSGAITLNNNVKGELQTGVAGPFSPAGTGKIKMVAGAANLNNGVTAPNPGGYSELNIRNNLANAATTNIPTDIEVSGSGQVVINVPAGSGTQLQVLRNLTIGSNQELVPFKSSTGATTFQRLEFTGVTLTGNATFSPQKPLFGAVGNDSPDLILDAITDSGNGFGITMNGMRTLNLNGNNAFTGGVTINSGTVQLGNAGALNSTTPQTVTFSSGSTGVLRLGINAVTAGGLVTNATPGTPFVEDGLAAAATLTISTIGTPTFAGVLRDGSAGGALSLNKSGSGTQTLSGNNTFSGSATVTAGVLVLSGSNSYSGPTAVNGGTLRLNTASFNNISGSPSITVGAAGTLDVTNVSGGAGLSLTGSQMITNNGTVSGGISSFSGNMVRGSGTYSALTMNDGTLSPGNSVGTLKADSLAMSGGTWLVEVDGATSDVVQVTNAATFTGGGITFSLLHPATQPFYDILTAGSLTGLPTINNPTIGRTTFSFDPAAPANTIRIKVVGTPASLFWNNTGATGDGATWENAQVQKNFTNGGNPDFFYDGDNVTFDDNNNAHYAVTISSTVAPGSVTFNNSAGDYTLNGGTIGGNGGLTKNGTSAVTILTSNTFTGPTVINAGTVNDGVSGALGAGTITIAGGVLNVNASGAMNTGAVTLTSGTLNLANGGVSIAGTLTINGGTLDNTSGSALALGSNNAQVWGGSFAFTGTSDLNLGTGGVTLNSNPTITVNAGTLTVGGAIVNGTGNSITKAGAGQLTLAGANSFSGGLTINAGAVRLSTNASAGGAAAGTIAVNPSGTLIGTTLTFANPITLAGGTIGSNGNSTYSSNVTVNTDSTIQIADPLATATGGDVIITGNLLGSGNLNVLAGTNQTSPDGGNGFRLRGTGASNYSGTITLNNNVKGELQTAVAGPFSPAGTGKIVMVAGAASLNASTNAPASGGYSEFNLRNNIGGTAILGTNVEVTGSGLVVMNVPTNLAAGTLNVKVVMGDLKIGGQELAVYKSTTAGTPGFLEFQTVTLTGNATFSPKKPGFGAANVDAGDLILDAISETAVGSSITMGGLRTLVLNGNNTFTGGLTINSGTVQLANPGALNTTTPNAVTLVGNNGTVLPKLQLNGTSVAVNGLNSSGGASATAAVVENGNATTAATLTVDSTSNPTFDGVMQNGAAAALSLAQTGTGTFTLTGNNTYTGTTTISAGGTLRVGSGVGSTSGAISGTSSVSGGAGSLLYLNRNSGDWTLPGAITGSLAVTKDGNNAVTLTGSSNYSGDTNVNLGALVVNGGISGSTIKVNSGGTLAGVGSLFNVTMAGGGAIHPGSAAADLSAGNLAMSTLTVNGGDYRVDVGGDQINVNGLAHFTAASTISPVSNVAPGTYTILTAGTLTIDAGQNPTVNQVTGARETFSLNLSTPNTIKLNVVGTVANLLWKGNLDAGGGTFLWDVQGTKNFINTSSGNIADFFFNGDNPTFDDTAINKTVTVNGSVQPGTLTVNNSVGAGNDYTLTGNGTIDGFGTLVKNGGGTLTISTNNPNGYSGGTLINAGVVNANSFGALGTGTITISGGTLNANSSGNLNTGAVTLNSGRFNIGNSGLALVGTLTVNGGTLDNTSGGPSALASNNPQIWGGSFAFAGSNDLDLGTGAVTMMNGSPTITASAGTLTVGGAIGDGGAGYGITKTGAGVLSLTNTTSTFSGPAAVTGGTLSIARDGSLGTAPASVNAAAITLDNGTLRVNNGTAANAGAGNATLRTNRGITLGAGGGTISIGFVDTATGNHVGSEIALVYNGVITGAGGLTVVGLAGSGSTSTQSSILDLSAVATYQGNTTINNAIVQVNSGSTGTNNGAAVVNILPTGTTLNLINTGTWNIDSAASNLTVAGLTGDEFGKIGTSNQTTNSVITLSGSGTYSFPGIIGATTVAGKVGDNPHLSLVKSGNGTQVLSGFNTYAGVTTISGGILSTSILASGGSASGIGAATNLPANLIINGGTLQFIGAGGDAFTDHAFTLGTAGGTLDASSPDNSAANFTNGAAVAFSSTTAPVTLTLTGTSTGANTLNAAIGNPGTGANITTLSKTGSGTWNLSGNNTYSGNTTIAAGTLGLTGGGLNNIPGTPRVAIATGASLDVTGLSSGTLVLGFGSVSQTVAAPSPAPAGPPNTGAVIGSLEVRAGSAIAGGTGSQLTVSTGVTLDDGSVSSFTLGAPNGSNNAATAFVNVTGALGLTVGGTHTLNLSGTAQPGTYELYSFTAGTPTANQFAIGANSAGNYLYSFSVTANQEVDLMVQIAPSLVWTGATDNSWDTTTANWNSMNGLYINGASAQFDDTNASGHNAIVVAAGGVTASHVIFANSTHDYSISGGAITGSAPIDKSGSGAVTINVTNNTNTGATTITGGTLAIAADGSLGSAPGAPVPNQLTINGGQLTILNPTTLAATRGIQVGNAAGMIGANPTTGGTINVAGPATNVVTFNGIIGNVTGQAGVLNKEGPGELDLGGVNTFSGALNINNGTVKTTVAGAQGAGTIRIGAGATFATGSDLTVANAVTLAGGTIGGSGANRTLNGDITAATGTTSTVDLFDPTIPATRIELVHLGTLHGSGNILVQQAAAVTTPDNQAFRLRGPASSDYTGTITVTQAGKFELQTTVASGSPAGTGKIVVTGGTIDATNNGTFTVFNLRDNFTSDTVFGNNVEMAGSGSVLMNMLGSAPGGTIYTMGNLKIGDTQDIIVGSTGATSHTLQFNTVELNGGTASFSPQPVGNTNYVAPDNIILGPVSQDVAGSSILAKGLGTVTLTGAGTYTGTTTVQSGTLALSSDGNLGTAPAVSTPDRLIVNGGQLQTTGATPVVLSPTRGFSVGANGGSLGTNSSVSLTIQGRTRFDNPTATLTIVAGNYVKFNGSTNAVAVTTGSSVTVATGATLELAGSASALSDGTSPNSVNVVNNSNAAVGGLLATGTNQKVGGIDGTGTTTVAASSDLTANHIVQSALVIGGDATHPATFAIAASGSDGSPLGQASGLAVAGSLGSSAPLGTPNSIIGGASASNSLGTVPLSLVSLGGATAAVPEPSTLLLAMAGVAAAFGVAVRRSRGRKS